MINIRSSQLSDLCIYAIYAKDLGPWLVKKCERPLNILEISQKGKEQHIFGPVQSFEISALTKGFSEDLTHTLDYTQWIIHKLMKLGMCIQESSDCQI